MVRSTTVRRCQVLLSSQYSRCWERCRPQDLAHHQEATSCSPEGPWGLAGGPVGWGALEGTWEAVWGHLMSTPCPGSSPSGGPVSRCSAEDSLPHSQPSLPLAQPHVISAVSVLCIQGKELQSTWYLIFPWCPEARLLKWSCIQRKWPYNAPVHSCLTRS